jgi:hypothetical protein
MVVAGAEREVQRTQRTQRSTDAEMRRAAAVAAAAAAAAEQLEKRGRNVGYEAPIKERTCERSVRPRPNVGTRQMEIWGCEGGSPCLLVFLHCLRTDQLTALTLLALLDKQQAA